MSPDRSMRHSLFKALGLAVKSTSFDPKRIMTIMNILTAFCPCYPESTSQKEDIATSMINGISSPQPATDLTERQSPSPQPATDLAERHSPTPPPAMEHTDRHSPSQQPVMGHAERQSPSPQRTMERPEHHPPGDAQINTGQTHDDHEYTTALKEKGDAESYSPHYDVTPLSLEPPRWSAVVEYNGYRSSAEGSTKKAARHSASKALWLQMTGSSVILERSF
ncbi:hypothetical protein N7520_002480 [Penicillium odoratum]|uniref:uncharacterized protein n=1 Tax=Penicillium odoratum TaxID=1167516 RepID=UPI002547A11E|nr:uncharacterized protein N7520_002480 [Penicillium odoratum]KAJ5771951.1 hypothetical protein N7520_002480 [Penicillium odoratum]